MLVGILIITIILLCFVVGYLHHELSEIEFRFSRSELDKRSMQSVIEALEQENAQLTINQRQYYPPESI